MQRRHSLRCTFSCGIMILDLFISVVFIQGSIAAKSKGLGIPSKCRCADSRFFAKRQSVATMAMLALTRKVMRASTTFSLNLKCQFNVSEKKCVCQRIDFC